MKQTEPARGEIWLVDLDPIRGHEPSGKRPALVISVDIFNKGPSGLAVVLPVTSKYKSIPLHVEINPPEGGVKKTSYIKCEDIRSISRERLISFWGKVSAKSMEAIEDRLKILLGL